MFTLKSLWLETDLAGDLWGKLFQRMVMGLTAGSVEVGIGRYSSDTFTSAHGVMTKHSASNLLSMSGR